MRTYNPTLWQDGLKNALLEASSEAEASLVGEVASLETSDKPSEKYAWIGDAFAMELLRDELVYRGLSDAEYTVSNSSYAIGLKVHKDHISDDKLNAIMSRVSEMMAVGANFPNALLIAAMINGTSLLGFDGVSFFNDTHPARGLGTAFDNLQAGSGVTVANIRTDVAALFAASALVKNEAGEPFPSSRRAWTFVVPPALELDFHEALTAPIISQTSNVKFDKLDIKVISSPRLVDANDWYAFDRSRKRKGLIFQQHTALTPSMLGPGSDHYFKQNEFLFKVEWRGGAGYNHPALAYKFVNS